MVKRVLAFLKTTRAPTGAIEEVAQMAVMLSAVAQQCQVLAGTIVAFESILEHHGLLTAEVIEAVKPRIAEKLGRSTKEDVPPPAEQCQA